LSKPYPKLDWDAYYNNEPFYKKFRDQDVNDLLRQAGYDDDKHISLVTPQYTYMDEVDYKEAIQGDGEINENTGRLAAGVQWFGFGAWT